MIRASGSASYTSAVIHPGRSSGLKLDHLIEVAQPPQPSRPGQARRPSLLAGPRVLAARCEVDDLPLMGPEYRMDAASRQHRQMNE